MDNRGLYNTLDMVVIQTGATSDMVCKLWARLSSDHCRLVDQKGVPEGRGRIWQRWFVPAPHADAYKTAYARGAFFNSIVEDLSVCIGKAVSPVPKGERVAPAGLRIRLNPSCTPEEYEQLHGVYLENGGNIRDSWPNMPFLVPFWTHFVEFPSEYQRQQCRIALSRRPYVLRDGSRYPCIDDWDLQTEYPNRSFLTVQILFPCDESGSKLKVMRAFKRAGIGFQPRDERQIIGRLEAEFPDMASGLEWDVGGLDVTFEELTVSLKSAAETVRVDVHPKAMVRYLHPTTLTWVKV